MDRTYLSAPAVVTASRAFVCVRIATYEDEAEAAFTESIFRGRGGLENSVFTLLAPDGETLLTRSGRSPRMVFGGATAEDKLEAMVAEMDGVSQRYAEEARALAALPTAMDLRRGLNVAACDLQPIAVLAVADAEDRARAEERLAQLAWSDEFIGECQYVVVADAAELAALEGVPEGLVKEGELAEGGGVLVVQPGAFGLTGKVLAHAAADDPKAVRAALAAGLEAFEATAVDSREHVRSGRRTGKIWETVLDKEDGRPRRRGTERAPSEPGSDAGG